MKVPARFYWTATRAIMDFVLKSRWNRGVHGPKKKLERFEVISHNPSRTVNQQTPRYFVKKKKNNDSLSYKYLHLHCSSAISDCAK